MSSADLLSSFLARLPAVGMRVRPVPPEDLQRLATEWKLELPAEYVALMTEVGAVGGPGYGLVAPKRLLAEGLAPRTLARAHGRPRLGKVLIVAEHGCAQWDVLVTQGDCRGQVWTQEPGGAVQEIAGRPLLLDWYAAWLEDVEKHGLGLPYRLFARPRGDKPKEPVAGWTCGVCQHHHPTPEPPTRCQACDGPRSYLRALR